VRGLREIGAALRGNPLESPANPLSGGQLLSQVTSGEQLWGPGGGSGGDPMRLGTAYRCVQILAATAASCPLHIRERKTKKPVSVALLDSERQGTTPFELWETSIAHQALRGNTYVRKVRARTGLIVGLVPIDPGRVTVSIVDVESAGIGVPYAKRFVIDGRTDDPLTENEIMHVPGMSTNGIVGMSPVAQMRRTFAGATAAEMVAERLFQDGLLLSGFLSTDAKLDNEKAEILRSRWRAKHSGVKNAWDVAVMDQGMRFQQMSMSPADAQFLETRKFATTEIARIYGVPGWMVNDQEKSTSWGSGMETMFKSFVVLTLRPYLIRFEQRIDRELLDPAEERSEFVAEGLLRGDAKARAAYYNAGITGGWLVPNEPRAHEGLAPVPWGNEPYLPHNTAAGDQPGSTDTPNKGEDDDDDDQ